MALKALMLRKRINDLKKDLDALRAKDVDFAVREAEIEAAINEASTEEERIAVEEAMNAFETEKAEHETKKGELKETVGRLEEELAEVDTESTIEQTEQRSDAKKSKKGEKIIMNHRKFFNLTMEQRDAFFAHDDVKDFLSRARNLASEKRAISGGELLIPTIVLDVIRENVIDYSKLYRHVNVRYIPGKARQAVMGAIPEGVWTEMCANLNELNISFNGVEVDGYKVGGYFAVCNAVLEDSDIDLAYEIISALLQAIGLALDKAILYGTGTKMPLGIVTRLAQTSDPGTETSTIPWVDLSKTNVIAISEKTDTALFKALVTATGAAKGDYSRGRKFWAMNETTYTQLVANSVSVSAAGAIVSGVNGEMPVIGGAIEVLSFIPDGVIIGGYGDLYLLAERAGSAVSASEHVQFIQDNTVFKGTARYDGLPVIAAGFVAIGINGIAPVAGAVSFAPDNANNPASGG